MERIDYSGKDEDLRRALDFVSQNSLGNVLIANDTPTASTLKANNWTYYGGELFYKTSTGVSFKFTVTII